MLTIKSYTAQFISHYCLSERMKKRESCRTITNSKCFLNSKVKGRERESSGQNMMMTNSSIVQSWAEQRQLKLLLVLELDLEPQNTHSDLSLDVEVRVFRQCVDKTPSIISFLRGAWTFCLNGRSIALLPTKGDQIWSDFYKLHHSNICLLKIQTIWIN